MKKLSEQEIEDALEFWNSDIDFHALREQALEYQLLVQDHDTLTEDYEELYKKLEWYKDKHRKALRHAQYCGDQWEYYENHADQLAVIADALASDVLGRFDMEKIYKIEERDSEYNGVHKYRFYSLYNGTRGAWSYRKENAIKEGEIHQKIILSLHTHNQPFEPTNTGSLA